MAYTLGQYQFKTLQEYDAARRDMGKIAKLRRVGRSTADIARNYKQQLREKRIIFESVVGEDFIRDLDRSMFVRPEGTERQRYDAYVKEPKETAHTVLTARHGRRADGGRDTSAAAAGTARGQARRAEDAREWKGAERTTQAARGWERYLQNNGQDGEYGGMAAEALPEYQGTRTGAARAPKSAYGTEAVEAGNIYNAEAVGAGNGSAWDISAYVERRVRSGRRLAFKWGTVIALFVCMVGLGYVFFRESNNEYNSYQSMQELQELERVGTVAAAGDEIVSDIVGAEETAEEAQVRERAVMPQYEVLHEKNPDMVGWLKIPDTVIDYPVMYREGDNDYYLEHNFEGEEDRNGLLVLDKRCNPDASGAHILIHGHNMKSGAMFGSLDEYKNKAYYEAHPTIRFNTLYEERTYEIVAVFLSSVYDETDTKNFAYYDYIQIDSEEDFDSYMTNVMSQSLYDTGMEYKYGDEIITLSTCEYSQKNGRLVIVGRRSLDG